MEKGFYHPQRGYWQAVGDVPIEILNGYPEGTVEVPAKPGANHQWNGVAWVFVEPSASEISAKKLATPLEPYQFHAMVDIIEGNGRPLNITSLINAIPDVASKAVARSKYAHAKSFLRNDPLVAGLSAQAGLTASEMDAYWLQALEL